MASSDDAATDQFHDLTDVRVAPVIGVCTVVPTLSLEYGAGTKAPLVCRPSSPALYFAYVFSCGAALSVRTWMALIAVITLGTFGFLVF